MKKGIVDPWRVVTPLTPEKKPAVKPNTKIDPSEIDFDADMRVKERCVFKSPHGSVIITGVDITSTDAGLVALVNCLHEISLSKAGYALLGKECIHFSFDHEPHSGGGLRTTGDGPPVTLSFKGQTNTEGMLHLIRVLNTVRRQTGPDILERWGVTTMMR